MGGRPDRHRGSDTPTSAGVGAHGDDRNTLTPLVTGIPRLRQTSRSAGSTVAPAAPRLAPRIDATACRTRPHCYDAAPAASAPGPARDEAPAGITTLSRTS
jgi:hypothetical protein